MVFFQVWQACYLNIIAHTCMPGGIGKSSSTKTTKRIKRIPMNKKSRHNNCKDSFEIYLDGKVA
jgi:hypothetical protein